MEPIVKEAVELSAWDTVVFTIPLIAMSLIGMLGLDERFVNPKLVRKRRQRFCRAERLLFTDPDGEPCQVRPAADFRATDRAQTTIAGVRETDSSQL